MEHRKEIVYWLGTLTTAGVAALLVPILIVFNLIGLAWRIVTATVKNLFECGKIIVMFVPDSVVAFDDGYRSRRLKKANKQQKS